MIEVMNDKGPPRQHPSRAQWLRRLATRRRDTIGFVLSGGGPLGALQVGALKALFEHDIRPDLVVGTSVGALNAAWIAFEPTPRGIADLEGTWRRLKEPDLFPGGGRFKTSWARMLVRGNRVFENIGIRRLVENTLGRPRFEDAQIPLAVVATELETGVERIFSSGDIVEPLLASTAMPGIFPPVPIDGRNYIDGGVANNVPVAPAVAMGATTLYVMDATSHARQRRPLGRPIDYLLHAFSLARSQRAMIEEPMFADRVRIVKLPAIAHDFFVPFASLEFTDKLIEMAHSQTSRFLDGLPSEQRGGDVEAIVPGK